jgi:thymidylate kinase
MFYKVFYSKTIILKDRYTTDFIATMIEVWKYNIVFKILYSFLPSADLNLKIQVFPETSWKRRWKIKNLNFYILKEEIYSNILWNKKNIIFINNENNIEKSVSNILKKIYLKQKLEKIKVLKISWIDGAGKSTTIENIEEILKSLNISYTQIHFYYNYIPIKLIKILRKIQWKKEKSTQEYNEASIENEKKSKNKNKNLFWKIYVLTDAIIQFSYLKLIGFNKLKIYDRYFLDYKISWDFLWVTYNKWIFDFFWKYSKNYFILWADAETLYKRKPEHTEEFFQETVTAYKKLQIEYKLDFINTAEKSPEQVTEYILNKVQ